jgi:hypothetical protein
MTKPKSEFWAVLVIGWVLLGDHHAPLRGVDNRGWHGPSGSMVMTGVDS